MSSSHSALIVDADPKGLEALVYGFQGADWRTTACPTPETASLLVKASGADIVVIASRVDHDKAHTLIRQVRSKETFRTLPLLVLGPEELRKSLKESSDADLLPLPAFVRDVLTASRLLVEAGAAAAQKPGEEPSFATPIAPITTLSLIRTLCGLARSGQLQLERKGRHGEILFHEGELTAAQLGSLQGMAAVQHMLIWDDGGSKLNLRPVARRGQLHQTVQEFIEEFDRFQRDFAHAMKDIGPAATVYARSEERLKHSGNAVPAEVTPVVRLCDGERSLVDIIDESPFRVLDTVRILGRLVDLAILVRRDPKPESEKAKRAPLEDFWETAKIVGPVVPRASRPRIDIADQPTPPPVTPAAAATSAPRHPTPAPHEGRGHRHKKTLEILPPAPPIPVTANSAVQAPTASATVTESATVNDPPAAAPLTTGSLGTIAWPSTPAPASGAIPALGAKQTITARLPVLPPAPALVPGPAGSPGGPVPQPPTQVETLPTPLANLPVTGAMHDAGLNQTGATRSPFLPEAKAAVPGTQASGTIEPRERRTQSAMRTIPARNSVVLDIAQLEIPSSAAAAPEISPVVIQPAGGPVAKVTGEIQVSPSRKTARQMPVPTMSIQLDATLAEPVTVANAQSKNRDTTKTTPSPMRLTGDMKISSPGKATQSPEASGRPSSSFQIDPSLAAGTNAPPTENLERASGASPVAAAPEQRKQSGSFSPLEKDFFEREAELYKDEGTESFADLDDKRTKTGATAGTGKKSNRPTRK